MQILSFKEMREQAKRASEARAQAQPVHASVSASETMRASEARQNNLEFPLPEPAAPAPAEISAPQNPAPAPETCEPASLLNENQKRFVEFGCHADELLMIGSAGTGKSFSTRELLYRLREIEPVFDGVHEHIPVGVPAVLVCSFTNRAVKNSRKYVGADFTYNVHTIHRSVEYRPEYYEVYDETTGEYKTTMRFTPARNKENPCPEISVVIIEEAGQCSLQLYEELRDAFPNARFIYLGDIYQLPPIYGSSILGYKLADAAAGKLPHVELTHVYRQALDSPILRLALAVKNGSCEEFLERNLKRKNRHEFANPNDPESKLVINVIDPKSDPYGSLPRNKDDREFAITALNRRWGTAFQKTLLAGKFDPEQDVVLIPHRKPHTFGAWQINRYIADAIRQRDDLTIHEVLAGFNKYYYALGDRVTNGRVEGKIVAIERNRKYFGKLTRAPSKELNRWGKPANADSALAQDLLSAPDEFTNFTPEQIDALLKSDLKDDERTAQCSHVITIETPEGQRIPFSTSRDVNELDFCYALTCHQAQGSEWDRVFILLHSAHAGMYSREWLYTAMTRAKRECQIICRPPALQKCIERQVIKGETLAEKAEFFKGKQEERARSQALQAELDLDEENA